MTQWRATEKVAMSAAPITYDTVENNGNIYDDLLREQHLRARDSSLQELCLAENVSRVDHCGSSRRISTWRCEPIDKR